MNPSEVDEIRARLKEPEFNPSIAKRELARNIIGQFHGPEAAVEGEAHFNRIHVDKDAPENIDAIELKGGGDGVWIVEALTEADMLPSRSAAKRMIQQGGVRIDGEKIEDVDLRLTKRDKPYTVKVGKRRFISIMVD